MALDSVVLRGHFLYSLWIGGPQNIILQTLRSCYFSICMWLQTELLTFMGMYKQLSKHHLVISPIIVLNPVGLIVTSASLIYLGSYILSLVIIRKLLWSSSRFPLHVWTNSTINNIKNICLGPAETILNSQYFLRNVHSIRLYLICVIYILFISNSHWFKINALVQWCTLIHACFYYVELLIRSLGIPLSQSKLLCGVPIEFSFFLYLY